MIAIAGDIHGDIDVLTRYIRAKNPKLLIQLGDFGFWPGTYGFSKLFDITEPIWFIDGNHENHDSLRQYSGQLFPDCGVEYIKRGTVRDLPTGERALFIGGAASIDFAQRTPGFDWFPQEVISERDIAELPDEQIDVVFSHTCPECIKKKIIRACNGSDDFKDPSTTYLQIIMDKYKPSQWFFAHWHISQDLKYAGTEFHCLDINEIRILR